MKVILIVLVLGCASAYGQDAGAFAAQQAEQATQQAMQAA